jgi:hydroxyacylglutathione hydrolase
MISKDFLSITMMSVIHPIPCLKDNVTWIIQNPELRAVVVDPGEYAPVRARLRRDHLQLDAILITHNHRDHVGGVGALLKDYPSCRIWGPTDLPLVTNEATEGTEISLFDGDLYLTTWHTPGHTRDHVSFVGQDLVFCGDTLFSGGCGRVLDSTVDELFLSIQRICTLPHTTKLYCGHEYTLKNLQFALTILPGDRAIENYLRAVSQKIERGEISLPSDLEREHTINIFLRASDEEVTKALHSFENSKIYSPLSNFTLLRKLKDGY